ncbi:hypothetical protein N7532_010546 [Penicillium argentinense]|uniref:Zn(2)-C6 fungal-type domain-containing protein n=1 Tax=Penicillium argentinense TaxID=1131581 RepID=A0A9W9EQ12_9EURO|nr:uncharacterized protein N7532_010546 [Penicillium argentinense]KAJ5085775.1 hypothetical protein N7532_010546 [Penicillium argentinense]
MPPRLSHRKSTTGCLRCKARKVKCDENRPQCTHCVRHNVPCEWPALATRIYKPNQPKLSNALSKRPAPALQLGLPSPELGGLRVLELRLMHHWTTTTAETMSSAQLASVREMWSVSVPQMAFEYEPLLHTLLALGAAHRSTLLPDEANSLRPVYQGYIDSALRRHRPVTSDLNENTGESVALNAVLLSLYTLFLRSEPSSEPYEPPMMWLSMAHGIRTVMAQVFHQLVRNKSRLCPLLFAQPTLWDRKEQATSYDGPAKPFHFLLSYRRDEEVLDDKDESAYMDAVQYLERLYVAVETHEPEFIVRKMFSGFPPVVPRHFLRLVSDKRPRALAILARLFALGKTVDNIWWLRGIPEKEVVGINSIMPAQWRWTMDWPLILVSKDSRQGNVSVPVTNRSVIDALF